MCRQLFRNMEECLRRWMPVKVKELDGFGYMQYTRTRTHIYVYGTIMLQSTGLFYGLFGLKVTEEE